MPDYLRIENRNSLAYEIEACVPFLDDDLVNIAFALSARLRRRKYLVKYIHRAAMKFLGQMLWSTLQINTGFLWINVIFTHALIQECFDVIETRSLH